MKLKPNETYTKCKLYQMTLYKVKFHELNLDLIKKNCNIIIRSKTMEDELPFPLNSKNHSQYHDNLSSNNLTLQIKYLGKTNKCMNYIEFKKSFI